LKNRIVQNIIVHTIKSLTKKILDFRDKRNWKQFHNPKDVALSMMLEAGEVGEHFQWKNNEEMMKYSKDHKKEIGEELADVMWWVLLLSHDLDIDILDTLNKKISKNNIRYPVNKVTGSHQKYTEYK
jgi:NTP pyrophosphatase (non-canonical NTP hydrolase)